MQSEISENACLTSFREVEDTETWGCCLHYQELKLIRKRRLYLCYITAQTNMNYLFYLLIQTQFLQKAIPLKSGVLQSL